MHPILAVIRQFNWVDILFIILFVRTLYISFKNGFVAEFFKFFGVVLSIYIALHYYTVLSDIMRERLGLDQRMPLQFLDFCCFLVLAVFAYFVGFLLREAFGRLIKLEAIPALNKWGALILSIARTILLVALITFALSISTISYLHNKVAKSYFGPSLIKVAPAAYRSIWRGVASKFMKNEKLNQTVLEAQDNFY